MIRSYGLNHRHLHRLIEEMQYIAIFTADPRLKRVMQYKSAMLARYLLRCRYHEYANPARTS